MVAREARASSRLLYSSSVRFRLKPVLWTLVAILAAGAAGYTAVRLDRAELIDFAVPRVAAMRFLAHERLYRPEDGHYQFKYFPAFAALMVPFTWPPKQVAEAAWFTLTVAMTWAFLRLALHTLPERRMSMSALLWLTLLLNGKFLVKELAFGQFNLPLGLLLLGAVIAARQGRGLAAGGLIAAGVFIKPYALVLLPWLVWTQGWRPLMPFAIVVTAGLALPAVSYGWEGNIALLQGWYRTVTDTTAPNLLAHENISLASMWAHTLCKERQNVRIQSIGLGKLSRRLGEVADLTWIRHHQRESRGGERTVMRRRRAISSPLRHWPDVS